MKKISVFLMVAVVLSALVSSTTGWALHPGSGKKLYIDVHHLGKGNVTAEAVAEAHEKDLTTQGRYGVNFIKYWVDEKSGTVYCLSEAPNEEMVTRTHEEAHGLIPHEVHPVTSGKEVPASGDLKYFLDIHYLGAGNVTAEAVAEAHEKDLEVQEKYGVNFINYWVDEEAGIVYCLSQAQNPGSVIHTHTEAHGLIPNQIDEVITGQ
ncbi:DUF4242 domain-containing protein [Gaoshiqia sp. Z1-71]|uniref:DUF4242 domain-containing protein n=1 Tax=Gaoshiqia hydrogeniformans TaxID=3290090 RepID=UPI003BF7CEC4